MTPVNYAYAPGDVRRYGAVPGSLTSPEGQSPGVTNAPDATAAFQAAINAGYSPQVPTGYYGISSTLVLNQPNQVITGLGNGVYLVKLANVILVNIQGAGAGLRNVNVYGNYSNSNFGIVPLGRPPTPIKTPPAPKGQTRRISGYWTRLPASGLGRMVCIGWTVRLRRSTC